MKTSKILQFAFLALPVLTMQSCLKDQEDIFDKPSATRMTEFLQQTKTTLTGSENGWILDYYPESAQSYGGFTYTLKFTDDDVEARFENYPDYGAETSLWATKSDDGPVISFDTYNSYLHYYATPSSSSYTGDEGDFEFVVDSIGTDAVKIHGKRTLNTMYLRRLQEPAADYINKVVSMGDSFIPVEIDVMVAGQPFVFEITSLAERQMTIYDGSGEEVATTAYNFTGTGIAFYKEVTLAGVPVKYINYDDASLTLTADHLTTTHFYVDPVEAVSQIGDIGAGNAADERQFNVPHLDQYTITSDASWVHTSKSGDVLTVSIDANPDSTKIRSAVVTVANGDYSDSFRVTQMELSAILGSYTLYLAHYYSGYQYDRHQATLAYSGTQLQLTIDDYEDGVVTFPVSYLDGAGALIMQSGQQVFSYRSYTIADVFGFDGGYWTSASTSYYNLMTISGDEDGNATFTLNGELCRNRGGYLQDYGYTISPLYLYCYSGSISSANATGWWDQITNSVLVKNNSSAAKPFVPVAAEAPAASKQVKQLTGNKLRRAFGDFTTLRVQNLPQIK